METTRRRLFLQSVLGGLGGLPLLAQQAGMEPYVPKQSDRPEPATGDEPGFHPIFDGKTLNGWEGDPVYWKVEDGCIVGTITPETVIKSNTFIIWRGGTVKDFELKVDYRITSAGNSGINYRSVVVEDKVTPTNKFAMRGYQCDLDGRKRYTGNNYEEKGRLFLAVRGQMTHVLGTQIPIILSMFGDADQMASLVTDDWNSVHLIVRGNMLAHIVNGHLMSIVIDDDAKGRTMEGLVGVQVHVGGPMKVEYRGFRIKNL